MGKILSLITYHYVRPPNERFSEKHKFLEVSEFVRQLNILEPGHFFVDGRKIKDSKFVSNFSKKRAVWLTFDDGYLDHYIHVYPNLLSKKAVGTFFIPTKAIFERKLLDVNKVHILLSLDITTNQIIGRANRIGRKIPLDVHYLK